MEFIDRMAQLDGYVPLFQTLIWVALILICIRLFREHVNSLLKAIVSRVERGSSLKAWSFELGALEELKRVEPNAPADASILNETVVDIDIRSLNRQEIYSENRNLFIAHVYTPSKYPQQKFDIFIYLIRHSPDDNFPSDLSDVVKAEFFFGRYWGNHIFEANRVGNRLGVSTSAYGAFLCTCLVTFTDGYQAMLHRYIDFEMANVLPNM